MLLSAKAHRRAVDCSHFTAILTAVISGDFGLFPLPSSASPVTSLFRPYLQVLFLGNPYRFFAPNPVPPMKLYFRVVHQDETSHSIEFPRRQDCTTSSVYHRYLKIIENGVQRIPIRKGRNRWLLTRTSKICLASLVRGIAKTLVDWKHCRQKRSSTKSMFMRSTVSSFLPARAAMEGTRTSYASIASFHLGDMLQMVPNGQGRAHRLPVELFVANIIERDIVAARRHRNGSKDGDTEPALAERSTVPEAVHTLLAEHPEILNEASGKLSERIQRAIFEQS